MIGDNPPIYDVVLEVNAAVIGEDSTRILQPEGVPLRIEPTGETVAIRLPETEGYAILEIR